MRPRIDRRSWQAGSGLVGVVIGVAIAAISMVSLAAVQVAASQTREQSLKRELVLGGLEANLEKIKGTSPALVSATFNGLLVTVAGVQGIYLGGAAILISVDSTNPRLLVVTANSGWIVRGATETFHVIYEVYNP